MIEAIGLDGKIHIEAPFKGRAEPHELLCGKPAFRPLNPKFGVLGTKCVECRRIAQDRSDLEMCSS